MNRSARNLIRAAAIAPLCVAMAGLSGPAFAAGGPLAGQGAAAGLQGTVSNVTRTVGQGGDAFGLQSRERVVTPVPVPGEHGVNRPHPGGHAPGRPAAHGGSIGVRVHPTHAGPSGPTGPRGPVPSPGHKRPGKRTGKARPTAPHAPAKHAPAKRAG
ncbi:hypothetical protein EBO15_00005, partial [Actinomadura harenae]